MVPSKECSLQNVPYKILDYPICHRLALARQHYFDITTKIRAAVRTRGAERRAATRGDATLHRSEVLAGRSPTRRNSMR
jgi:hypothetical protein